MVTFHSSILLQHFTISKIQFHNWRPIDNNKYIKQCVQKTNRFAQNLNTSQGGILMHTESGDFGLGEVSAHSAKTCFPDPDIDELETFPIQYVRQILSARLSLLLPSNQASNQTQ